MMRLLDESAIAFITAYNAIPRCASRYNPAAEKVYRERLRIGDPLLAEFEPYIVYGLERFDMGRIMGSDFAPRLKRSLEAVRLLPFVAEFRDSRLSSVDLSLRGSEIMRAYQCLAPEGALHPKKQCHVAATKVLHWLFPDLFLMMDSKVAKMFRDVFGVPYVKSTQPGYSAEKYVQCLQLAQSDMRLFGAARFGMLEPNTPEARIFDKVGWAWFPPR
jgi:hypothetical protein